MAWQTLKFKLTASAPLIMHNGLMADPTNKWSKSLKQISSKRTKTDADYEEMARIEFLAGLYMGSDGPIIPSYVIDGMILNGAKKSKDGPRAKSGVFCLEHSKLEYDGPRDANDLWEDERFRHSAMVRVQSARISRMRPIFDKWSIVVTVNIEDTLVNPQTVYEWLVVAGVQVGLCDRRPQYGRFTVERLNGHN